MHKVKRERFYLTRDATLKRLESPTVYHVKKDELYEVDETAFEFLRLASTRDGVTLEPCQSQDNGPNGPATANSGDCRQSPETGSRFIEYCVSEGLLSTQPQWVARRQPLPSPVPSLRYLELQITDRCNLRCRHCYLGKGRSNVLPLATILDILVEFEKIQGLRLLITGGEPLRHPQFDALNAALPSFAFRKVLLTNGLLLSPALLESLNMDEVQVSIDGMEKGHDAIRGKGTFAPAMRGLNAAVARGLDSSVATMVHSLNLNDFDQMESLFKGLGIKEWTVDVPCETGNMAGQTDIIVSPEVGGPYLRYGFGEGLHGGGEGLACGAHLASITAEGNVAKCAFYADTPLGHISEGLSRCWQRLRHRRIEELACDCDIVGVCRGGCRFRAQILGNPLGKDYYRCHSFKDHRD